VPGGIRTPNLLIRSQKLYPVELQAQYPKTQAPNPKGQNREFGSWDLGLGFCEAGWPTGLEPATTRTTIWGSTIELRPPSLTRKQTLKFQSFFANKGLDIPQSLAYFSTPVEGKAGLPWPVIAPRHRMRRVCLILFVIVFLIFAANRLWGQQDDPSEIFLKAYLSAQQGEKLEHENRFKTALAKFRFAGSLIEELRKSHSNWQPAIVEYRGRKIGEGILRVQGSISRQNELSATASPLPEIVPSLPESEAWSEPGPEVVAPEGFDSISQEPSEAAIEEATRKLRRKVDQLQVALQKSRSDLETAQKEKEAANTRLKETSSKLEEARATAEKQRDETNAKLAEANKQIAAAQQQRDEALAQLKAGSETDQHMQALLADNGDLKQKLANAEKEVPDNDNSANTEELAGVKQQVTQLQQQLADSQKRNEYLVARIAELWVHLDETGEQPQSAKLTGKNSEETDRLLKENELLRNIIVRERQEEARREEARSLMLAELDRLKIKSGGLNRQIEILTQPLTKLSSEELSLLRQPVISVSDQNQGVLTASFIFAKKSSGDSAEGEAIMNNSSGLKTDVRDGSQTVAAARESFSGASTEQQKPAPANPDQGSE
jgi:hypothetical protein